MSSASNQHFRACGAILSSLSDSQQRLSKLVQRIDYVTVKDEDTLRKFARDMEAHFARLKQIEDRDELIAGLTEAEQALIETKAIIETDRKGGKQ